MNIKNNAMWIGLAVAVAAVVVLAAPVPSHAASLGMSVNIPFEFHVGDKTLPAGNYAVKKRGDTLSFNDGKGHSSFVLTNAVQYTSEKRGNLLVFNRYNNSYFVTEARWDGQSAARRLLKAPSEIELSSKNLAFPETVTATGR